MKSNYDSCFLVMARDYPTHMYDHDVVVTSFDAAKKYIIDDLNEDAWGSSIKESDLSIRKVKDGHRVSLRGYEDGMKYTIVECTNLMGRTRK